MYIRLKTSKKAKHPTLQIVEGFRKGDKVLQRTVAHLGVIKSQQDLERLKDLADKLIQRLEKEGLKIDPKVEVRKLRHKRTVYDGFKTAVDRLMDLIGFSAITRSAQGRHQFDLEETIKLILVQRFDLPSSKLRTFERQEEHGFSGIDLQHVYRSMDAMEPLGDEIQKQAFIAAQEASGKQVDCIFFDVTTLYFESVEQDEIKAFGYSKDQKHHQVQLVLALVVDANGLPIAFDVFEGNLAETKTLIPVLNGLRNRFSIKHITVVCDRGMASKTNVEALQASEFQYVIATKLRGMSRSLKINDLSTYSSLNQKTSDTEDEVQVRTMPHPQYKDTLLIATYSPARAEKDKEDRDRLLEKLRKKLSGNESEGSVKKIVSNAGYKKFTDVKDGSAVTIDEEAVKEDALWDGFHGIAVSNGSEMSIHEALSRYRDLWRVEEAFRVAKCTLKTRPIFHWTPNRIKSHVLLCFMNLFIERFLELLLRKNQINLTPDRIRYALGQIHTTFFDDGSEEAEGKMPSALTKDAEQIFRVLGLQIQRLTTMDPKCCA